MSQIVFYSTIDMQNVLGTPSNGFAIAYDSDGVLKQKDSTGLISRVGYSDQYGLEDILLFNNQAGTHSIILGQNSLLKSEIGNSYINLSNGNTYSVLINVGNSINGTSSILMESDKFQISKKNNNYDSNITILGNTFSTSFGNTLQSTNIIQDNKSFKIKVNQTYLGTEFNIPFIIENVSDNLNGLVKSSVNINSYNSITNLGVYNSVVIGGQNLLATQSNTVYLGNTVNINNQYKLPSLDGTLNQVLKTDGAGNSFWGYFDPPSTFSLNEVLSAGATTGSYSIVLGTAQAIITENGTSAIYLDYFGVTNSLVITNDALSTNRIQLSDNDLLFNCGSGIITTTDNFGLRYSEDYSDTFVDSSLVTKLYVDSITNPSYHYTYKTVYVDSFYGDNSTATIGRIDLPFLTFASASQALSTLSSISGVNKMYIRKGSYNELIILSDNTDYYCELGCNFNGYGFSDDSLSVNCNIYGYGKFTGLNPALEVKNSSNVNFEFDSIDNIDVALKLSGTGEINVRGRFLKSKCDFGSAISIEGSGKINLNITDGIYGAYDTIYVKNGFTGDLIVNSKEVVCDSNISTQGNLVNQGHALNVDNSVNGKVVVNSNLYNKNSASITGNNSSVRIGSGDVTVNGNIYGGEEVGLFLTNGGLVTINGNINSTTSLCINNQSSSSLKINNSFISNNSNYTISVKGESYTYLLNSTLHNSSEDSSIFYLEGLSNLSIYNCIGYTEGDTGYFIFATPSSANIGIHNTRSNKDNSSNINDIFSPSGFIYDSDFYIPNF